MLAKTKYQAKTKHLIYLDLFGNNHIFVQTSTCTLIQLKLFRQIFNKLRNSTYQAQKFLNIMHTP